MAKKQQRWPEEPEDLDQEDDFKSKSQLKREMQALQTMGETLVALPNAQLDQIPLDDTLSEAIALARRLKNREGKRRQLQYIGKLMRKKEEEPAAPPAPSKEEQLLTEIRDLLKKQSEK